MSSEYILRQQIKGYLERLYSVMSQPEIDMVDVDFIYWKLTRRIETLKQLTNENRD